MLDVDSPATVVAAIGRVNSKKEAAYHDIDVTGGQDTPFKITFNRIEMKRKCIPFRTTSASNTKNRLVRPNVWDQAVFEDETTFEVEIGPAGGDQGYTGITGLQSWGIALWVNKELIPEIHVKRGTEYTFVVRSGKDPSRQAKYHPLYITDNPEGGDGQEPEKLNTPGHKVFAGIVFKNNVPDPTPGAGHYCELKHRTVDVADKVKSVSEYKKTLREECEPGEPAIFKWTPDDSTPNTVYYQCYTHRNLGWKILVSGSHFLTPSLLILFITIIISISKNI
jgi:hypothetical protein